MDQMNYEAQWKKRHGNLHMEVKYEVWKWEPRCRILEVDLNYKQPSFLIWLKANRPLTKCKIWNQ